MGSRTGKCPLMLVRKGRVRALDVKNRLAYCSDDAGERCDQSSLYFWPVHACDSGHLSHSQVTSRTVNRVKVTEFLHTLCISCSPRPLLFLARVTDSTQIAHYGGVNTVSSADEARKRRSQSPWCY